MFWLRIHTGNSVLSFLNMNNFVEATFNSFKDLIHYAEPFVREGYDISIGINIEEAEK